MVKKNACIFISGNGSNLKIFNRQIKDTIIFPINISLVINNNKNANGIFTQKIQFLFFY